MPKRIPQTPDPLPTGTPAPPLRLPVADESPPAPASASSTERRISLADYPGKNLVLAFYPADFTPVCSDELGIFNELLPEFERLNAQVLGISVDSKWCHAAFARERHLHFPLLADFHPKGEVSRAYHSYREEEGFAERALYVIDAARTIFWSSLSPLDENPGADGVLDALERLAGSEAAEGRAVSP